MPVRRIDRDHPGAREPRAGGGRAPDAEVVIAELGLRPHPEGGWYAETWRDPAPDGVRPAGSAIYFLLRAGERSRWHRVDAAETWHHYAGAALELRIAVPPADGAGASRAGETAARVARHVLGSDLAAGERPQVVVPAGAWQTAESLGAWTLVGCTVAPAFEFAGFELAPDGWEPTPGAVDAGPDEPVGRAGGGPDGRG